uniref:NADH-ubiquinone oxidoreductase chain 2 n=1 Tax=Trachys auricollis TaxID=2705174 RepID=A0A6C0AA86_9COLE|nr:NADH dehydrogenase subunit 2 [Trachys auricollis]QHS71072.1 NADH dehydrogenase subunit 2 [Trachys auricollis]
MAGTLITISSNSWLGMWMGLEINLLSIIPLMTDSNNPRASESSLKYFITQALASIIVLTSIMMMNTQTWMNNNLASIDTPDMLMVTSLLLKTGAAPFHFWFPEVVEGSTWINALILLTWQKIAPMMMLMYNKLPILMAMAIMASITVGSIMGLNQTSLRKILSFSSINHIGWMLAIVLFAEKIWILYFTTYLAMNSMLIWLFSLLKTSHLNQLLTNIQTNPSLKAFFMMNFLSLGGTPPFVGFLPKWLTIQSLVANQMYMMSFLLIIAALITLYYYLRIALSTMIFSAPLTSMINKMSNLKKKNLIMMNSFILTSLILYIATFSMI